MRSVLFVSFVFAFVSAQLNAADEEYRTVETAIRANPKPAVASTTAIPGHLGVLFKADAKGPAVIDGVEANSAADKAGLKPGDTFTAIDGKKTSNVEDFRTVLRSRGAGERVNLALLRDGKPIDVTTVLPLPSKPVAPVRTQPALLGVEVTATKDAEGVLIEQVIPGTTADKSKLKVGETILKVDDVTVTGPDKLREVLLSKKPDETVNLTLIVAEKKVEMKIKLAEPAQPTAGPGTGRPGGGFGRSRYWNKPVFRIAIINVEYSDAKHDAKITAKDWADAMFSTGTFKKYATGTDAFGSMNDYYMEQSHGQLKIEGKSFEPVELSKKKMEYNTGPRTLLGEAMDLLLKRDGKDALKDFDGVFFIYAGRTGTVPRGSLYWPHKANFQHGGRDWPYFICPELGGQARGGQAQMMNISVFCHEFGHILGLPDLYARPENPGMEGAGIWSAMANQAGNGRPQHFDAWSKEKLGWIKPVPIDPTVKQKLILAPINDSPKECFKILAQPDGSEHFLLENRLLKGFDKSLPADGLLIWRVIGNRPILEESHGVAGPQGPRLFSGLVPFPSDANRAFTPFTIPSSRSQLPGGLPVYITNIQKRPDGKITFHVGYEYQ